MVPAAKPQKPGRASLVLIWLLSIAGVVLLYTTTGVPRYLGLGVIVAGSVVSIRHSLRLRAYFRDAKSERSQDP
jgi:hypothetical protein